MKWTVLFHDKFEKEFDELPQEVQDKIFEYAGMLEEFGSTLKRPRFATLSGSKITNLKEIRFDAADGVWRVLFAFNPKRQCILLVAGDKSGVSESRFYKQNIKKAEQRYKDTLNI